jgi:hypothetical protein
MTAALITDLAVSEREKDAGIDTAYDIAREVNDPVSFYVISVFRVVCKIDVICRCWECCFQSLV